MVSSRFPMENSYCHIALPPKVGSWLLGRIRLDESMMVGGALVVACRRVVWDVGCPAPLEEVLVLLHYTEKGVRGCVRFTLPR